MPRCRWGILVSVVVALAPVPALPAGLVGQPIVDDPAIVQGRLENGLRYYIQTNARPQKRAELRLVVNAGSVEEDDDQRGVAHLIEHLCFRATRHFPQGALVHRLQSFGMDFGPHVNAVTRFDDTVYKLSVPSDAEEPLRTGLQILRDWAGEVSFDTADVDKERQVVIEEWRQRLGADQRLLEQALPVLFKGSRYAERLPIGKKEVVESVSIETLRRFYRDWYRPDNMAVVVVGDIDSGKAEAWVREFFGDLKGPPAARRKPDLSVPIGHDWLYSTASDPEMGSNVVRVVFPQTSRPVDTVENYRERLARTLVLQALNTRLTERRDTAPSPFLFAQSSFGHSLARARSDALLIALVGDGGVAAGLGALIQESERVRRFGFTAGELVDAKRNVQKSAEAQYLERAKRESDVLASACVANFLQQEPLPSPEWMYAQTKAAMERTTADDMNRAARELFAGGSAIVRVETALKSGAAVETIDDLKAIVRRVQSSPIEAVPEKRAPATLMTRMPESGRIVARKTVASIGITELELSNGVRVVLKPSTFKKDEVFFSAFRPGGLSALPAELDLAGKFAAGYVSEAGLASFSKTDLQKILAGKQAGLAMRIDPYFDVLRGRCSAADLETAFQLVHLAYGEARRDENVYRSVVALNHTFEANVLLNPSLSFINDTIDLRFARHPRVQRLIQPEAQWKTLTLDKVGEAYRQRFGTAGGFTFVFVGSFTLPEIEPLVCGYLGSLPASVHASEWKDLGIREIAGPFEETIERGADPKGLLLLYDEREASCSVRDAHLVWSLGSILQRALLDRLRFDRASAYNLKVVAKLDSIPFGHATLEIAVPGAPENTAATANVVDEEIDRLIMNGPSADEVQKELEFQKRTLEKAAESNGDWLWKLERIYQYNEDFRRLESPNGLMDFVTAANLHAAARQYWRTDKWVRFNLRPKASASH
jgi:zinc protease